MATSGITLCQGPRSGPPATGQPALTKESFNHPIPENPIFLLLIKKKILDTMWLLITRLLYIFTIWMRHRIGGMGQGKKEGRGHWDNIGGLKHKHPHPQHLSYPFTPQFRSPWFPSTQKTWCVGGKSLGNNPPPRQVKGLYPQIPKTVPFKKIRSFLYHCTQQGNSLLSLSHSLSLGSTALEKEEDPHPPASPIHILAVTSTPTLNTGGQSEELGSDGGNTPPQTGEESFQSNL